MNVHNLNEKALTRELCLWSPIARYEVLILRKDPIRSVRLLQEAGHLLGIYPDEELQIYDCRFMRLGSNLMFILPDALTIPDGPHEFMRVKRTTPLRDDKGRPVPGSIIELGLTSLYPIDT